MYKLRIRVVAAIFHDGDKIFAAQRAYGQFASYWEFPGGKIEPGEFAEDALKREIREELGIEIKILGFRTNIVYEYDTFFLDMDVFDCKTDRKSIELNPKIHQNGGWFTKEECQKLTWCPADQSIFSASEKYYPFYGACRANMAPILAKYSKIANPRELYAFLERCWCKESCSSRLRDHWDEADKTLGQCNPTAFLAQDIFGGKVLGLPLENGMIHCFNEVDGTVFDLTSEQFHGREMPYIHCAEQNRDEHFLKEPEKKERYLALKKRLDSLLFKE